MANGHGGKRNGAGRKPTRFGFRSWCRDIVLGDDVLKGIADKAKTDPEFALRLAEHGFGRPPQSLDIKGGAADGKTVYAVELPGADLTAAAFKDVPDARPN